MYCIQQLLLVSSVKASYRNDCLASHLVPSQLCVRAFALGIAAGRMELLEQASWVPTEFIEQALRVATGTLSRSLSLPAVISDMRSLF